MKRYWQIGVGAAAFLMVNGCATKEEPAPKAASVSAVQPTPEQQAQIDQLKAQAIQANTRK